MDSIKKLMDKWHLSRLMQFRRYVAPAGLCCVSFDATQVYLVYTKAKMGRIELVVCESVPYTPQTLVFVLSQLVATHQLQGVPCTWILPTDKYQLILHEELPVTPAEFQSAVRWTIKDLSHVPMNDATIDFFPLPIAKISNAKKMIMIVVAEESYLQTMVEEFQEGGLNITGIDIPELALRNINALYEKDDVSTALIYMQEKITNVIVTHQKTFYLSRRLDFDLAQLADMTHQEAHLDVLALEVQRSFDYFQSQWRYPPPGRVLLSATSQVIDILTPLSKRLMVPINILNLHDALIARADLNLQQQAQLLPVIGGTLPEGIKYSATAN